MSISKQRRKIHNSNNIISNNNNSLKKSFQAKSKTTMDTEEDDAELKITSKANTSDKSSNNKSDNNTGNKVTGKFKLRGKRGLMKNNNNKKQAPSTKPSLQIDTSNGSNDGGIASPTPKGMRGKSDIRSPGVAKTPVSLSGAAEEQQKTFENSNKPAGDEYKECEDSDNNTAPPTPSPSSKIVSPTEAAAATSAAQQQQQQDPPIPIPDFITQTDAYGNPVTPRSNDAINAARKEHPSGPKPHLHVDKNGNLTEDEEEEEGKVAASAGGTTTDISDVEDEPADAWESFLDGMRMMCCNCLYTTHPPPPPSSSSRSADTPDNKTRRSSKKKRSSSSKGELSVDSATSSQGNNSRNSNSFYKSSKNKMQCQNYITICHTKSESTHDDYNDYDENRDLDADVDDDANTIKLLPQIHPDDNGKKCLVLDLDETLVHSSFRAVSNADFVIPVQIEDIVHFVYVLKRPGVDEFLLEMSKYYEIVIYTASLNKYANPLLDLLDIHGVIRTRLFRESCVYYEGNYVKDLSLLNRDIKDTIIIDNSPASYIFHPENAIDCTSFIDDPRDTELYAISKFLSEHIQYQNDIRYVINRWREWPFQS